jgi:hypothetical protein
MTLLPLWAFMACSRVSFIINRINKPAGFNTPIYMLTRNNFVTPGVSNINGQLKMDNYREIIENMFKSVGH